MQTSRITTILTTATAITGILFSAGCQAPQSMPDKVSLSTDPAGKLALVENGQSVAPIVVFEDAPPFTRRAADELATYIEKTSGARPEVVEGEPNPIPENAIWVGYQPVLDDLFPNVDFEFKHPEEILIAANDDHLVIAGRDRWNPDGLKIKGSRGKTINGVQVEYGTINAVYTFLQDYLGVRFLWPGELGEDVLSRETIAFEPFRYRYHPQIRYRSGLFGFSSLGNKGYGRSHRWTRLQRVQLGSLGFGGSHAFTSWWERFHEIHPEYFALQPGGTRGYASPRTVKMCQSNPMLWEQWLADVDVKLGKNPNKRVFNAAANDGWASGHCICEECRAWDHPDGELRTFRWEALGQQYVALSDRHVTLANQCARLLKQRYPDKDYYVSTLAYGHSRPPPIEAVPDDNVIIASVANFLFRHGMKDRGSPQGVTHREQFQGWGEVAPHLMWRPNTGSPAGWQQGLPDVPISQAVQDFKFLAELNGIGIFIDSTWEHWATQGPLYYVMANLVWNPAQDAEAILDDYYRRGFGPAAQEIDAYWSLLEETRQKYRQGNESYPAVYNDAFFEKAYSLMDNAAEAAAQAADKYSNRIAFMRAGLDFTRLATENKRLAKRYRESDKTDKEAAEKMRYNYEEIRSICKEFPYAINWGPLRPKTGRLVHPDHMK